MPRRETLTLLREALTLLNERPNFGLRCDPTFTSYKLAARIDAHLASFAAEEAHPTVDRARRRWSDEDDIQVDEGESEVADGRDGVWVRAWLRVPANDSGSDGDPDPPKPPGVAASIGPSGH